MPGLVKIPCPHCGHEVEMTPRQFQTSISMRCANCATITDFAPDRRKAGGKVRSRPTK